MTNEKEIVSFETCKLWAEIIHNMIQESFTYYGYLQGLKELFPNKNKLSMPCVEFIEHLKYLLQSTICLNLSKMLFDNGHDVYSLNQYKRKIEFYTGSKLIIKKPKISKALEKDILAFRNNYIAHSIENREAIKIHMKNLFDLLMDANNYYNSITTIDILGKEYRFEKHTINTWINHCKLGIMGCLTLNK